MQDLKPYNQNLVRETGGVSALTHQAMSNTSAALIIRAAVRAGTHRECSGSRARTHSRRWQHDKHSVLLQIFGELSPTGLELNLRWDRASFKERTRLYCWVHMLRAVRGWLPSHINKTTEGSVEAAGEKRGDFYRDLKALHCCGSDDLFEDGVRLLKSKWSTAYPLLWKSFESTWVRQAGTWYVGCHAIPGFVPRHTVP